MLTILQYYELIKYLDIAKVRCSADNVINQSNKLMPSVIRIVLWFKVD